MKKISIVTFILLALMLVGCGKNAKNESKINMDTPAVKIESEVAHKESDMVHKKTDTVNKEFLNSENIDKPIDNNNGVVPDSETSVIKIVGDEKKNTSVTSINTNTVPKATVTPDATPATAITPSAEATTPAKDSPEPIKQHDSITLIIQEEGKQILNCSVEIKDGGESLNSVMNRVADRIGMQLTNKGGYISCMNGMRANGFKGWVYSKNGVIPNVGISGQIVTKGDEIIWNYGDHSNLIL